MMDLSKLLRLQQMDRLRSQVETQQDLKAPIKALAEKAGFIVKHH